MSKCIVYKHPSGEIAVIRRDKVGAFLPKYERIHDYKVFAVVGNEKICVHQCTSAQEAEAWILSQVALIDSEDVLVKEKE